MSIQLHWKETFGPPKVLLTGQYPVELGSNRKDKSIIEVGLLHFAW